jgi:hypothetical protein
MVRKLPRVDPIRRSLEDRMPKPKLVSQAELDAVNGSTLDPIIDALLDHLPAPGDYWPTDQRKKWLQMIELSFDIIYVDHPTATDEPYDPLHPRDGQT